MVRKGLTTVEICILLAIIAMIAAVIFIVIDPAAKKAAVRNAQRWTDVALLMEGVQTVFTESHGELSGDLTGIDTDPTTVQMITSGTTQTSCGNICATETVAAYDCSVDFSAMAHDGYVAAVPMDPLSTDATSEYYMNYNDGVFTVGSCVAEEEKNGSTPTIRISR